MWGPEKMKCFVMMPFAVEHRSTYDKAIKPAVEECELECIREDEQTGIGPVIDDISKHIKGASMCIADLTGLNPNVIYETALAHSKGIPVVLITQDELGRLPFDLKSLRAIKFSDTETGYKELRNKLAQTIKQVILAPEAPIRYLQEMLVPSSLSFSEERFVIAASPLSWQAAIRSKEGFEKLQGTFSDQVGIRGLIQAFGLIYGLNRLPDLIDPGDYFDKVLVQNMHLYSIGSPKVNRWTGLLLKSFYQKWGPCLEFKADPRSDDLRNIRVMVERDGVLYLPHTFDPVHDNRFYKDFGLVIRGPHPNNPSDMFMVLAGRSSLGTEAACRAATDPDCICEIKGKLDKKKIVLNDHKQAFYAVVSMERQKKAEDEQIYESVNLEVGDAYPFKQR